MLELNPEFRHELAAARADDLRRFAEPLPPGRLRRAVGAGLVRLGLRLGYDDGRVPPFVTQLVSEDGPPAQAGGPSWSPAALRFRANAGVTRT